MTNTIQQSDIFKTSLMEEYLAQEKSLAGFTLSYKSFFEQFNIHDCGGDYFIRWNHDILWRGIGDSGKAVDFAKHQILWISSPEIQQLYLKNPKELKIECQKRINFFVNFLHQKGGNGYDGKLHFKLRDIRNLAYLCIK
jgi:hypothetical protein